MRHSLIVWTLIVTVAACAQGPEAAQADGAAGDPQARIRKAHTYFSAHCFNQCWGFLDKAERTPQEVEEMLLLAHASLWHWTQRADATPLNLSVGYWQVSRAYALAGECSMATAFGEKCLAVGRENSLSPFYLGCAYEALARAQLLQADTTKAVEYLGHARAQLSRVTDKDEKQLLDADLAGIAKALASR